MPSPPTACGSPSSTPRSTTGSCARSWRATSPRLRPPSAPPSASSMVRSPAASPLHGCQQPPDQPRSAVHAYISGLKTQDRYQSPSSQARLGREAHLLGRGAAVDAERLGIGASVRGRADEYAVAGVVGLGGTGVVAERPGRRFTWLFSGGAGWRLGAIVDGMTIA